MKNPTEQIRYQEAHRLKSRSAMSSFFALGALLVAQSAFSKDFFWAQQGGGTGGGASSGVAVDGAGNCYVAGYFAGTATFGDMVVPGSGASDIYLAKYDSTGQILWFRTAGGRSGDFCHAVTIDGSGNCYLTGSFQDAAAFGNALISSTGASDVFVAKYDSAGNFQWVRGSGGTYNDEGSGIGTSLSGEVFVAGTYAGSATFGTTLTFMTRRAPSSLNMTQTERSDG